MRQLLTKIGKKSKEAFAVQINSKKKDKVLKDYYNLIDRNRKLIINENKKDIKNAYKKKIRPNLIQRLVLNDKKISSIIQSIKKIIKLKDPTNIILEKWKRPNGLRISKISIPIGAVSYTHLTLPTT